MKTIIKKMYMFFCHPILFFCFTRKNNLIVKGRCDIKKIHKIKLGKNVQFGSETRINFYDETDDVKLIIGDNSYFVNRVTILGGGVINIGKDVLVASDVAFFSENHSIKPEANMPYKEQPLVFNDIFIGEGTWIGEKVIILPGVSIGKGCVIGAGSVVTKSVPNWSIVVGNPAKVIKIFDFKANKWKKCEKEM